MLFSLKKMHFDWSKTIFINIFIYKAGILICLAFIELRKKTKTKLQNYFAQDILIK